ncbi:MAG: maleylpyruvate isomerase family mycothiol-dependent enzyme [Actinomycetota bacterium]|nr:maleylpyruvate isomerase family mycothiol-dependent enzyme [Actinomycetota bacterium]
MASDIWEFIHPERDALAADLDGISDEQWALQSPCDRWTVRQVVAHMTTAAMMTPAKFVVSLAASGFSFPKYADKELAKYVGSTPHEALALFRAAAHRTTAPPGRGETWMGETVVHSEDVRRPLEIGHTYDMAALRRVADFYAGSNLIIGAKKRVEGVRLEATDTDWTKGDGPVAQGPMLAIVLAMTGRKPGIDELTGEGVGLLRQRS